AQLVQTAWRQGARAAIAAPATAGPPGPDAATAATGPDHPAARAAATVAAAAGGVLVGAAGDRGKSERGEQRPGANKGFHGGASYPGFGGFGRSNASEGIHRRQRCTKSGAWAQKSVFRTSEYSSVAPRKTGQRR